MADRARRRRPAAVDRLIIGEELIAAGAPIAAMWFADRQMGPTLIAFGRGPAAEFLPGSCRRDDLVHRHVRARTPGSDLASLKTGPAGRRRVGDQRAEDLDQLRRRRRLLLPDLPDVDRRAAAPGHQRDHRADATPGIEVRPITDMTTNRHFCEVFFTDVRVPAANLVGVEGNAFKQTMRQLEHERGGIDRLVSNRALYRLAVEPGRPDRSAGAPGDRRPSRPATGSAASSSLREVLKQAPAGFSAATKCFCTEHEWRVAEFVARVLGPEATLWNDVARGLHYAPATRSWAARRTSCATSSATCSACPEPR